MLREEGMKPLGISINGLALELHVPVTRISEIVNAAPLPHDMQGTRRLDEHRGIG
jgi:plasmid maintenance system antidote protein VapI